MGILEWTIGIFLLALLAILLLGLTAAAYKDGGLAGFIVAFLYSSILLGCLIASLVIGVA